jgi:hypothetical protein
MTSYPDAEDYIRAVQDPAAVFRTPVLKQARFELHPLLGIPMPASGNAAVVFRAGVDGQDTALRFFLREDASSRERYTALDRHFAARGLDDCVARASWVDEAITVNGAGWPLVRMTWVDGRTLDAYVGHLAGTGDTGALSTLAGAWRAFVARLQDAEFAHGDLQHGNVLVDTTSALRLVDFDGSWIAAVGGGSVPRETGHPNYQRTGREWGRWMDTFPALVIYTSLLALSRQPSAWAQLHTGENILFSAADFEPPFRTPAWQLVAALHDAEVDFAAARLMRACDPTWTATGPLEELLAAPAAPAPVPRSAPAPVYYPGVGAGAGGAWWARSPAARNPAPAPLPDTPAAAAAATAGPNAAAAAAAAPAVAGWDGRAVGAPTAGGAMPPPPPKSAPTGSGPVFAGVRSSGSGSGAGRTGRGASGSAAPGSGPKLGTSGAGWSWGRPAGPPAAPPGGQPPGGHTALLAVLIAVVAAVVLGGLVAVAGGNAAAAAVLGALLAGALAVPLLRRTGR